MREAAEVANAPAQRPAPLRSGALAGALGAVVLWGLAPVATRALVSQLAPLPLLVLRMSRDFKRLDSEANQPRSGAISGPSKSDEHRRTPPME